MDRKIFDFAAGIVLILFSLALLTMPVFLNMDAFIPLILSLVSFILGVGFFFMGHDEKE
ncbi:MAG: hypothetical protein JXC85_01615 [Candidatus Aenigmarchaeota archaeon]|nr:hypothetical protein [Candidatus Aenigmarchaeota archaeon]